MQLDEATIIKALDGDNEARSHVILHYDGYFNKMAKASIRDTKGRKRTIIDEDIKAELQAHLIDSLSDFDPDGGQHG